MSENREVGVALERVSKSVLRNCKELGGRIVVEAVSWVDRNF